MKLVPFTAPHFRRWAKGLILDNGRPWTVEPFQIAFVSDVFTGVKEAWDIIPEGNAKTTLVAGLGLYHAEFFDYANVPIAASSRDQAEILFRQMQGFVDRSRETTGALAGFRCYEGYRRIRFDARGSRIQVFAADDRTGDGVIPTLALIDELHRHRDLRLYRTWVGKLDKRKGQVVTISTRGEPGSEFEVALETILRRAPTVETTETFTRAVAPGLVLHQWAVPEGGDTDDIALVKRANPLKAITRTALREKRGSPTWTLGHWRRFTCNLPTRSEAAAITETEWYAAKVEDEIPAGAPVWLGLDVAWKWDTTAAVPWWERDPEYRLLGPATILVPPRNGDMLDGELVEAALLEIHARNPVHTVVMDSSRAEQLARWIETNLGAVVIDRAQSNPLAVEDYDRFMEGLREGTLKHTGDPGLTKHALNAVAKVLPLGDARFDRPNQSRLGPEQERRVIDALTAAAMVHSTAIVPAEPPAESMWAWA